MWDKYNLPIAIAKQCPLHFRAYDMHLTCYRHACMSSVSLICVDKITKYLRFWFLKFFFIENWMLFYSICLCLNLLQYCTDNRFLSLCNSNWQNCAESWPNLWMASIGYLVTTSVCCVVLGGLCSSIELNRVSNVKYPVIDLFMNNSNMGLVGESILSWVTTYLFSDQFTFIFKMCCYPMT